MRAKLVDTSLSEVSAVKYEEKVEHLFPPVAKHPVTRLRAIAPLKMAQLIHKYAYFAGGSVASGLLGIGFSDYDLYFSTLEKYEGFHDEMDKYCGKLLSKRRIVIQDSNIPKFDGYKLLQSKYTWTCATEFFTPIASFHSIGFLIGDPLAVINTFDLSCCQAAYDPNTYSYITTPAFEATKRTRQGTIEVYHSPLKTGNRVLKYIDRGIKFSYSELMKIYMVLDTEPKVNLEKTTKNDPFSGIYDGGSYRGKDEVLRLLEEAMEKTND